VPETYEPNDAHAKTRQPQTPDGKGVAADTTAEWQDLQLPPTLSEVGV
jgi:hypothetical protein